MKIRWFIGAVLIFILVCSACTAATVDERVSNVQQKLGLTDVKTAYLKQVLLEPIGNGLTRLDEAELLVQVAQQNAAIINQEYFDMVNYWLDYITGKTVGGVQDMACTLLGIGPVCDLIGNLETMRDISKNTHPALVLWNQIITRATIANYLELVTNSSDEEDQEVWNEIIEPGIANQLAGYYDVGSDGKTNGEALHEYCRKVWLANENLKAAQAKIDEFKSYIRSRTKGEAIIKITPTGSSTPITSAYAPCRVTFDGSASHATVGHSYTLQWTPTGSNAATLDRYYSTPGHYTVSLLVTQDDGWSWSTSVDFVVRSPRIIVTPDAADYHKFALGTDESADITAYSWDFGDGTPVSNLAAPAHIYAADGDYTVSLTITTSSGNLSVSKSIHVGRTGPTRITVGTITGDEVWNAGGSPYLVSSGLTIAQDASLTIGPGVVVKLANGAGLFCQGSIEARGTAEQPIYFTAYSDDSVGGDTDSAVETPYPGYWRCIGIGGIGSSGVFEHCVVRYGGNGASGGPANIYCYEGSLQVTDSTITQSNGDGINCVTSSDTLVANSVISECWGSGVTSGNYPGGLTVRNCRISNAAYGVWAWRCSSVTVTQCRIADSQYGVALTDCPTVALTDTAFDNNSINAASINGATGDLSFSGVTATSSGNNALAMANCTASIDSRWRANNGLTYVVADVTVAIGKKLTIEPGAVVKLASAKGLSCQGSIEARGTAEQPIYFTAYSDDSVGGDTDSAVETPYPGYWRCIGIGGIGSSGVFEHCVVRYGGNGASGGPANIYCYEGSLQVTSSTITRGQGAGVYCCYCSAVDLRNCIVARNQVGIWSTTPGDVTYCDAWSNASGDYSGVTPGVGCLSADPMFVSSSDYRLQGSSPCIDTGDPSLFDPDGTRSDMGAYRFADHTPPGSGDAKNRDSGQPVSLGTMYITATFEGFFYVENQNRCSGIRIEKPGHSFSVGAIVNISGTSGETTGGERCVLADIISPVGSGAIGPLAMSNKVLASGAFGYQQSSWQWQWIEDPTDSITDYRQRKVVDGKIMKECWRPCAGLNTTGLLVRTWGKVADPDPVNHVFYIDDGSTLTNYDGTRHGMKVVWNGTVPEPGANVILTGVASCEWDATCPSGQNTLLPVILAASVGTP